jgi:hypothetical protein
MWYFPDASHMNRRLNETRHYSARIIHERFCCNRQSLTQARRARRAGKARLAGTGLTRHASLAPRACRAPLCHFATNCHELSGLAVFALFVVGVLAYPCGAQTPSPVLPVQSQAVQTPQAEPSAGVSDQANVGPTSVPTPGVGSSTSSSTRKRYGSAGQGLPGMPGGPPIKGSMGSQDPSSRYMRPPVIPPLLCDPAVNIPC